ncbi:hypothetical protein IVB34_45425 [Bradyrhizobium sp. 2]|uniref:hypothetical protein n=1 Tax=Bradyrhizobium sp. 2 TaxID=190045 RepID=UPI001FFA3FC6|nr:hypothetical protein [Bradyrhizobium sp. 2]MCK1465400.1 hypothetical protein [Bradyrhizobium sp. 2]
MDVQTLRAALCEIFEQAAIWRSMQARDLESSDAGRLFRRLATTVDSIEDDALIVYWELWEEEADRQAHAELVRGRLRLPPHLGFRVRRSLYCRSVGRPAVPSRHALLD